jgi:hypothetical protein
MATKCSDADRRGRLQKATQFLIAAEIIDTFADDGDLIDAYITLCVHAGVAAADVICCVRLGEHAQGTSHTDAVALLEKADRKLAQDLAKLLRMKTRAGYGPVPSETTTRATAGRCASRLVETATAISS